MILCQLLDMIRNRVVILLALDTVHTITAIVNLSIRRRTKCPRRPHHSNRRRRLFDRESAGKMYGRTCSEREFSAARFLACVFLLFLVSEIIGALTFENSQLLIFSNGFLRVIILSILIGSRSIPNKLLFTLFEIPVKNVNAVGMVFWSNYSHFFYVLLLCLRKTPTHNIKIQKERQYSVSCKYLLYFVLLIELLPVPLIQNQYYYNE